MSFFHFAVLCGKFGILVLHFLAVHLGELAQFVEFLVFVGRRLAATNQGGGEECCCHKGEHAVGEFLHVSRFVISEGVSPIR